jgi:hypothetical protein
MVVSIRDFKATLAIGETVPMASTSKGIDLRSALATCTATERPPRAGPCAWALVAPDSIQDERVAYPVAATAATRVTKMSKLFFMISHAGATCRAVPQPPNETLKFPPAPLNRDLGILFPKKLSQIANPVQ